ncbi:MAG: response regulator transcription factor [Chloroflexota bacterium]
MLIVEDDQYLARIMAKYLVAEGYETRIAADGAAGLAEVDAWDPDLVVLDLMLPKVDGLEVCRRIRITRRMPIIMVTARGEVEDRVQGLDLGADDYLVKPFAMKELLSRVRALFRRAGGEPADRERTLTFPGLTIRPAKYEVTVAEQTVPLTPREFELLVLLANNPGQVLTREQLLERVWGYDYFGEPRTVDVHIKRLRSKLEAGGAPHTYIQTVWGVGYKFEVVDRE